MKKDKLIIITLSIILVILIVAIIINKKDNSSNNIVTENNEEYIPMSMRKDEKIVDVLVNDLNEMGIVLENKSESYIETLAEEGYRFTNNDDDVEIYQIDDIKMENIVKSQDGNLVIIETLDGDEIEAICYGNLIIITENEELKNSIIKEIGKN